jgi:hypothetical protein
MMFFPVILSFSGRFGITLKKCGNKDPRVEIR